MRPRSGKQKNAAKAKTLTAFFYRRPPVSQAAPPVGFYANGCPIGAARLPD
jgi:murein endopeptidase